MALSTRPPTQATGGGLTGVDTDPANELQTLNRTGTVVTLSAGGGSVSIKDNDPNPNNELNTGLELNGTTLEITDAGGTRSLDLVDLSLSSFDDLSGLPCNGGAGTVRSVYRRDGNDLVPILRCVVGDPCTNPVSIDESSPMSAAYAIGLCATEMHSGVLDARYVRANGDPAEPSRQAGILPDFGPNNLPTQGATLLALSTGRARDSSDPDFCVGMLGVASPNCDGLGAGEFPAGSFPFTQPGCPESQEPWDDIGLEFTLLAPAGATGFSFDYQFFTFEYQGGLCDNVGNDHFVALMAPAPAGALDGNIAFDANGNPVAVQMLRWKVCLNSGPVTTCESTDGLVGTGFDTFEDLAGVPDGLAGGTGWLTASAPVTGGQQFTLRFAIWDADDGAFDSTVLLDNFEWTMP